MVFSGEQLVWALLLTAGLIAVVEEWRISLLALLLQYVLVGFLLYGSLSPPIALAKIATGGMVFFIFYPTAWRGRRKPAAEMASQERTFTTSLPFRLVGSTLIGLVVYGLLHPYPWEEVPTHLAFASNFLMAMGLWTATLGRGPFRIGLGLLTFLIGFELLFTTWERSLLVAGLLALVNILLALAIPYLKAVELARGGVER
jgi:hypothetical protein